MIHLTKKGLVCDRASISQARQDYATSGCIVLPQFIDAHLQTLFHAALHGATFEATTHHGGADNNKFAKDVTIKGHEKALHLLHLLFNNATLFEVVQQVTDCQPIGCFGGRIYRTLPDSDHHLDWHDDREEPGRLVGLSLNLSPAPYSGGAFQLRQKGAEALLRTLIHTEPGDAHLFRIAAEVEHRVTPVAGTQARTAGAGWFSTQPDRRTMLHSLYGGSTHP